METLDYKTACIIAAYEYQIIDRQGNIFKIDHTERTSFVTTHDKFEIILFSNIGRKYWILAKPLESIREEQLELDIDRPDVWVEKDGVIMTHSGGEGGFNSFSPQELKEIIDIFRNNHFAINMEPEWWKPIK